VVGHVAAAVLGGAAAAATVAAATVASTRIVIGHGVHSARLTGRLMFRHAPGRRGDADHERRPGQYGPRLAHLASVSLGPSGRRPDPPFESGRLRPLFPGNRTFNRKTLDTAPRRPRPGVAAIMGG
jgi:hypothetical protein